MTVTSTRRRVNACRTIRECALQQLADLQTRTFQLAPYRRVLYHYPLSLDARCHTTRERDSVGVERREQQSSTHHAGGSVTPTLYAPARESASTRVAIT